MKIISKNIVFIFTTLFMLPNFVLAAPVINDSEINNGAMSISGSGFGVKNVATPQLWDAVDNQFSYAGLSDMENIPATVYHAVSQGGISTKYTTSRAQRGFRTAHYYSHGFKANVGDPIGVNDPNKVYATFWYKPSMSDFTSEGAPIGVNKFFRIWDDPAGLGTRISFSEYVTTWPILDIGQDAGGGSYPSGKYEVNQWNRVEIWVDAMNHVVKMSLNNKMMSSGNDFIKYTGTSEPLWVGHIGFDNSGTYGVSGNPLVLDFADMDHDWGEVYIDNTQARVELCDSSLWSTRNHCEIQPPTIWSDTLISAEFNQGSFVNGSAPYLYIVDEDGNMNENGYLLTLAGFSDTTAPTSPAGLSVM